MVDEMPTFDGTEPANLKDLLNGMSSAVDDRMAQLAEEVRTAQSVALVDDLPDTGNWVGRLTFVEEDGTLRVVSSLPNGWVTAYRVPVVGTIAWHPGWSAESGLSLERDADHVFLNFNAEKTSAVVTEETLGYLPAGFRPGDKIYCSGSYHGTGNPGAVIVAIEADGEMRVFFGGTTTQTKVAFCVAFPI